jgi:hypothetical protein
MVLWVGWGDGVKGVQAGRREEVNGVAGGADVDWGLRGGLGAERRGGGARFDDERPGEERKRAEDLVREARWRGRRRGRWRSGGGR